MSALKDTGKHTLISSMVLALLGAVGHQPAISWAQEVVAEIATREVSERVDQIELRQGELVTEQRSLREAIEASDKARNEQMQQLILLLRERRQ